MTGGSAPQGPDPLLKLVTPEQLQAMVDEMGRAQHGSDWDHNEFADGTPYVWTGKVLYEEVYRRGFSKALRVLGYEV